MNDIYAGSSTVDDDNAALTHEFGLGGPSEDGRPTPGKLALFGAIFGFCVGASPVTGVKQNGAVGAGVKGAAIGAAVGFALGALSK